MNAASYRSSNDVSQVWEEFKNGAIPLFSEHDFEINSSDPPSEPLAIQAWHVTRSDYLSITHRTPAFWEIRLQIELQNGGFGERQGQGSAGIAHEQPLTGWIKLESMEDVPRALDILRGVLKQGSYSPEIDR